MPTVRNSRTASARAFGDLRTHLEQRIETGHRVLEDHGDVGTAPGGQAPLVEAQHVLAGEADRAAYGRGRWQQAHHGLRRDGLAGA
jgi:hypothetical protein